MLGSCSMGDEMNTRLFIFGCGAHARKVFHCAVAAGYQVVAFVDENHAASSPVPTVQLIFAEDLSGMVDGGSIFVAIGRADVRKRLMDRFATEGWMLPPLVHPGAWVAPDVQLGEGVLVAAGAVVESLSIIGRGSIVDIGVIVDHDCQIDEFSHIKPGYICPPHTRFYN